MCIRDRFKVSGFWLEAHEVDFQIFFSGYFIRDSDGIRLKFGSLEYSFRVPEVELIFWIHSFEVSEKG